MHTKTKGLKSTCHGGTNARKGKQRKILCRDQMLNQAGLGSSAAIPHPLMTLDRSHSNSIHVTFIALIPKKNGALIIRDFRLISLTRNVYELISNILAIRLKTDAGEDRWAFSKCFCEQKTYS